jgi:hypothetical protein
MAQFEDPQEAQRQFNIALEYLKTSPETDVHRAHITAQTATYALAQDQGPSALPQLDQAINVMTRAENASILATLLLLKSEALKQAGKPEQARAVRVDSIGWARYGFGSDAVVRSAARDTPQSAASNTNG